MTIEQIAMTREEIERLLALCETIPEGALIIAGQTVPRSVQKAYDTTRTVLPRALREVLRLQDEVTERDKEIEELKAEVADWE